MKVGEQEKKFVKGTVSNSYLHVNGTVFIHIIIVIGTISNSYLYCGRNC